MNTFLNGVATGIIVILLIFIVLSYLGYIEWDDEVIDFEDDDLMSDDKIWGKGVVYRLIEEDLDDQIAAYEEWSNVRITPEERQELIRRVRYKFSDMEEFGLFCDYALDEITGKREGTDDGLEHYYDDFEKEDNDE